ncbi:unnamed protein product [Ceutorhynchus assimilis]|uniref:Uncharacterized protein n=1 Tax=Ceutorhynchus assimilis TaxID=467358 RepID=A0A9N9MHP1_9CUCU|nr:unnamed protein product [Ceutorhynchus assimilis]
MQEEFSWLRKKFDLMKESMHKKLDGIKNIVKKEQQIRQQHEKTVKNSAAHIRNAGTDTTDRDHVLNETNTTEVATTSLARTMKITKQQNKTAKKKKQKILQQRQKTKTPQPICQNLTDTENDASAVVEQKQIDQTEKSTINGE